MKRWIFRVALLLLSGAIINVAVAWGLVLTTERKLKDAEWGALALVTSTDNQNWEFRLFRLQFVQVLWWNQLLRSVATQGSIHSRPAWSSEPRVAPFAGDQFARYYFVEIGAGFPFASLAGRGTLPPMFASKQSCTAEGAILLEQLQFADSPRVLPLIPIWPGFALNTIFYAVVLWMLFAVPGAICRRVRRKRGQCAACGYSLRGNASEKCPECGAVVPAQRADGM